MLDLTGFGELGTIEEEEKIEKKIPQVGESLVIKLMSINDESRDAICYSEEYAGVYFYLNGEQLIPFIKTRSIIRLLNYTFSAVVESIENDKIYVSLKKRCLENKQRELLEDIQKGLESGQKVFCYAKVTERNYIYTKHGDKDVKIAFLKVDIEGTGLIGTILARSWEYGYFNDDMLSQVPIGKVVAVRILSINENNKGKIYCRCSRKDEEIHPNLWGKGLYKEGDIVNGICILVEPRKNYFVVELLMNRRMRLVCRMPKKNKKNLKINVGAVYTCIINKINIVEERFEGEVF